MSLHSVPITRAMAPRDNFALRFALSGRLAEAEPLFKRSLASQGWLDVAVA